MDNKSISSWVRQARYRAKKYSIYSDLKMEDVWDIIQIHDSRCAYCTGPMETLDHPFPLKDSAPNIPANVLPTCKECKKKKKNNDLPWLFSQKIISKERYIRIVDMMLKARKKTVMKEHIKMIIGMLEGDNG
jgi:hypothetical protein